MQLVKQVDFVVWVILLIHYPWTPRCDIPTGRQAGRQADRQTDRQTHRQTDRQTDRQIQTDS